MEKLPTLSNSAQLKIMRLVKAGMSMDDALKQASELEAEEQQVRTTADKKERSMTINNQSVKRKPGRSPTPSPQKDGRGSQSSEGPELSAAEINRQTLAVVTQMVKDGKVTAEEAKRHARQLANIKVRKAGDAQRILLVRHQRACVCRAS
jgi:polyhydroxyalkanoate synthesis regulator phasin